MVKPIPDGMSTVTPHLVVSPCADAIEFYKTAFGAEERFRMPSPDGTAVMHAEVGIGNSCIFLCDEFAAQGMKGPQAFGGSPISVHLYVNDVDAVFERAVTAGATALMPVQDTFWGDRYGKLTDPFGHQWSIATHVRDVSPEEMAQAMQNMGEECTQD